jgi:hypothetical protein
VSRYEPGVEPLAGFHDLPEVSVPKLVGDFTARTEILARRHQRLVCRGSLAFASAS